MKIKLTKSEVSHLSEMICFNNPFMFEDYYISKNMIVENWLQETVNGNASIKKLVGVVVNGIEKMAQKLKLKSSKAVQIKSQLRKLVSGADYKYSQVGKLLKSYITEYRKAASIKRNQLKKMSKVKREDATSSIAWGLIYAIGIFMLASSFIQGAITTIIYIALAISSGSIQVAGLSVVIGIVTMIIGYALYRLIKSLTSKDKETAKIQYESLKKKEAVAKKLLSKIQQKAKKK